MEKTEEEQEEVLEKGVTQSECEDGHLVGGRASCSTSNTADKRHCNFYIPIL